MKSNAKSSLYFSAYPLKAITETTAKTSTDSPYLKAVLSGPSKSNSKMRVFPMINPYKEAATVVLPRVFKPAKHVEASGDEWFGHYE